jgi:hypothetical protein
MRTGMPEPLMKRSRARDFELARGLRAIVVDQAQLGRGAAHVERTALRPRAFLIGDARRKDRPARRAGFDQPNGKPRGRVDRRHAACPAVIIRIGQAGPPGKAILEVALR